MEAEAEDLEGVTIADRETVGGEGDTPDDVIALKAGFAATGIVLACEGRAALAADDFPLAPTVAQTPPACGKEGP